MTTIDTSGVVKVTRKTLFGDTISHGVIWSELSPFAQGYVEAALAWSTNGAFAMVPHGDEMSSVRAAGFSDLAPEALAMILRDCEAAMHPAPTLGRYTADTGRQFWRDRQDGKWATLRPLTTYLNDAGKVMLELAK